MEAFRLYSPIYLNHGSRISNNGRPKSWHCCRWDEYIEVTLFYPHFVYDPLFPKKIQAGSLSSREGFFLTMLVSLSPKIFQPFPPQSLSLFIPSLEWVSHHEGSLALGKWAPICCIYLDRWGPLNILEMTPLELAPTSKFVFSRQISPRHYIMPLTISCGD